MINALNQLHGHRTFLLVALVVLPYVVLGIYLGIQQGVEAYTETLRFIADVLQSAGIALGASKAPDAIRRLAESRTEPRSAISTP